MFTKLAINKIEQSGFELRVSSTFVSELRVVRCIGNHLLKLNIRDELDNWKMPFDEIYCDVMRYCRTLRRLS